MNGMNKQSMKSRLGGVLVAQRLERRTFDQAVVGSIPGRVIIRGTRSTQPSMFHPSWKGKLCTSLTHWLRLMRGVLAYVSL